MPPAAGFVDGHTTQAEPPAQLSHVLVITADVGPARPRFRDGHTTHTDPPAGLPHVP